jgi:hypothetical protein
MSISKEKVKRWIFYRSMYASFIDNWPWKVFSLDIFVIRLVLKKENIKWRDDKYWTKARVKLFSSSSSLLDFSCSTHLVIVTSSSSYLKIILLTTFSLAFPIRQRGKEGISNCNTTGNWYIMKMNSLTIYKDKIFS